MPNPHTLLGGAFYALAFYIAFLWVPLAIRRSGILAEDAPQTADSQPLLGGLSKPLARITDERGKPIRSI